MGAPVDTITSSSPQLKQLVYLINICKREAPVDSVKGVTFVDMDKHVTTCRCSNKCVNSSGYRWCGRSSMASVKNSMHR